MFPSPRGGDENEEGTKEEQVVGTNALTAFKLLLLFRL
jgi:hypothetical protein